MYKVIIEKTADDDIKKLKKSGDKKSLEKVISLLGELSTNPRTETGKPEQLKGKDVETWSRRISQKHRLVYVIDDNEIKVLVIQAYGHYDDK